MPDRPSFKQLFSIPVIVAALGYFVDIYDLLLFGIVRIPSLLGIGVPESEVTTEGIFLINVQMFGLLIGGIIWGIYGDKRGRLSVLFGSILLYSIANIANGFAQTVNQYAFFRFFAGIGLAGELGAGVTLVSEILHKEIRGYGTALVATVGMFGAVLAYFVSKTYDWRMAYYIGGGLGVALLIMRFSVYESGMFNNVKEQRVSRGNFIQLFTNRSRLIRYISCILIGIPIWYVIGVLVILSPEFGRALGIAEVIDGGKAVMFSYLGLAAGDLSSGLISQWLKSRRKVVLLYIAFTACLMIIYIWAPVRTSAFIYTMAWLFGFAVGYWALFVTIAAEQFGTNLRATVTTTVPNFIRGTLPMLNFLFVLAKEQWQDRVGALVVGVGTIMVALIALRSLHETFSKDLDYVEE